MRNKLLIISEIGLLATCVSIYNTSKIQGIIMFIIAFLVPSIIKNIQDKKGE